MSLSCFLYLTIRTLNTQREEVQKISGEYNVKITDYNDSKEVSIKIYKKAILKGRKPQNQKTEGKVPNYQDNLRRSVSRAKSKLYDYSRANDWTGGLFVTLTFNPDKVDSYSYDESTKKLSKWLNNVKMRTAKELGYVIVAEPHESGRWHFHGIMKDWEGITLKDSKRKDKKGRTIYNIDDYGLGFTTATKIENSKAVTRYITKYITKEQYQKTKGKKKYWSSKNLKEPQVRELYLTPKKKDRMTVETIKKATWAKVVEVKQGSYENEISYFEL